MKCRKAGILNVAVPRKSLRIDLTGPENESQASCRCGSALSSCIGETTPASLQQFRTRSKINQIRTEELIPGLDVTPYRRGGEVHDVSLLAWPRNGWEFEF